MADSNYGNQGKWDSENEWSTGDSKEWDPDQSSTFYSKGYQEQSSDSKSYNEGRGNQNWDRETEKESARDQRKDSSKKNSNHSDWNDHSRWINDSKRNREPKQTSVFAIMISVFVCVIAIAAAAYFAVPVIQYHFFNHETEEQQNLVSESVTPTPYISVIEEETAQPEEIVIPEATQVPLPTATPTPIPTPTPEPVSFAGASTKEQQQEVIVPGQQLDLTHMGNLIANTGATYGTYILDVTNLQEYNAGNADTPLPASALIGVPILFTYAEKVSAGEISRDSLVVFHYTFENGRGIYKRGDEGRSFSAYDMMSQALKNSDNNALNSMMDFLTLSEINRVCHEYGYSSVDMQRKLMTGSSSLENYISAKDAAMMLNAIYQDNFGEIGRSFLQSNFKISTSDTSNKGMYPALGGASVFLNLNGITDTRYNEIALIQNGDETFILSCLTCNGVANASASGVQTLARYVGQTIRAL